MYFSKLNSFIRIRTYNSYKQEGALLAVEEHGDGGEEEEQGAGEADQATTPKAVEAQPPHPPSQRPLANSVLSLYVPVSFSLQCTVTYVTIQTVHFPLK